METKLDRIKVLSTQNTQMKFTSLYHHINEELLRKCHKELDGKKATGVDEITKSQYEKNLEGNLKNLVDGLKRKYYRPKPSLRVYKKKDNGKLRPLGIAAYEDKLIQGALKKILEAVYEPKFDKSMYGFRANLGQHDALRELNRQIERGKTNYVVDADIKGFFTGIDHDLVIDLIRHRIVDPNILWLIKKTLRAGVVEDGVKYSTTKGTEQGNLASPIIANIYMHYMLALWFKVVFKKQCKGECSLVIYADDVVATFQYEKEARRFLEAIKERFAQFKLELEPTKTKLIEFGRFAEENRRKQGLGKPETFDFLSFTHYCSKSKQGKFRVKRKTTKKKLKTKLKELNQWIRSVREVRLKQITQALNRKLIGHYQYYGITDNSAAINAYYRGAQEMLFKWLNRRSQKKSYNWESYKEMLKNFSLTPPKICVSIYDG